MEATAIIALHLSSQMMRNRLIGEKTTTVNTILSTHFELFEHSNKEVKDVTTATATVTATATRTSEKDE